MTYRIWNNTDLKESPLFFTSEAMAKKSWRDIKPGRGAGNAYAASFLVKCEKCGAWQDMEADHATCDCR